MVRGGKIECGTQYGEVRRTPHLSLHLVTSQCTIYDDLCGVLSPTMFLHCPSFIFLSSLLRGVFIYLPVLCMCQTPCSSSLGSAFMLCVVVYGLE
jgi:hypothetical protein